MMDLKDFSEKLKQTVQKLNILGEYCYKHAFLGFIISLAAIFAVVGMIFYHYAVDESFSGQNAKNGEVKIDRDLYQKIILRLNDKKEVFNGEVQIGQSLSDPFK